MTFVDALEEMTGSHCFVWSYSRQLESDTQSDDFRLVSQAEHPIPSQIMITEQSP